MIPRYTVNQNEDNRDLRVKLMIGDFSEDEFKKKIQQREKARQRKTDIRQVLEMYQAVLNDLFQAFATNKNSNELITSLTEVRLHVNSTFKKISKRYTNCATPTITEGFELV
jgi:16S rRNA C1402 N4-methylase RsmH